MTISVDLNGRHGNNVFRSRGTLWMLYKYVCIRKSLFIERFWLEGCYTRRRSN